MSSNVDNLRKLLITGLGTALMTEDALLKYFGDLKLPRDAKKYLTSQAQRGKQELSRVLSEELRRYLAKLNLEEVLRKALDGMKVDVEATVRFSRGRPSLSVTRAEVATPSKKKSTRKR